MLKAIALAVGATALAASAVTGVSATSAVVPNPAGSTGISSSVGVPVVGGQVGTVDHSNTVTLIYGSTSQYPGYVSDVTFTFNNQYSITGGQPWNGITTSTDLTTPGASTTAITAEAGRKNSLGPANWFDTQSTAAIGGDADHNGNPSELNFAFAGSLSVDGVSYPVVIGQGSNAQGNNWWIGGQGWTAGADGVIVSPDGKISLAIDYNGSGSPYANVFQLYTNS